MASSRSSSMPRCWRSPSTSRRARSDARPLVNFQRIRDRHDSMTGTIQIMLLMLTVLVAVAIIARRANIAPSILLVVAGMLLALFPGLPRIELAPEFVLLVVLPPLIYSAGVAMSW